MWPGCPETWGVLNRFCIIKKKHQHKQTRFCRARQNRTPGPGLFKFAWLEIDSTGFFQGIPVPLVVGNQLFSFWFVKGGSLALASFEMLPVSVVFLVQVWGPNPVDKTWF